MKTGTITSSFESSSKTAETRPSPINKRKLTKNIVAIVAYLVGIKTDRLESLYGDDCQELLEQLDTEKSAKTIRILCQIRTTMLNKYWTVDRNLNNLNNIDNMPELFDNNDIKWLRSNGIEAVKVNTHLDSYIASINKHILDSIDQCRKQIPSWVRWDLIRELFLMPNCYASMPKGIKNDSLNKAKKRYWDHVTNYPFQTYMNWPVEMADHGNVLLNDEKFLTLLYAANKVDFVESGHVRDAVNVTKTNIYQFIESSDKTALIVDCENCDVFNLFSTLHNLSPQAISKLAKVILYDDSNTTPVWSLIGRFMRVPVEHLQINRVAQHKSLVDITMTAGVCREFFQSGTQSFILASSDSDFWGLVKALPEAEFLVLMEYSKCGSALKDAMSTSGVYYCAMDDFCKGNIEEFKEMAFRALLQEFIDNFNNSGIWANFNAEEIVDSIFESCRFTGSDKQVQSDKARYLNKYFKAFRFELVDEKTDTKKQKRLKMSLGI